MCKGVGTEGSCSNLVIPIIRYPQSTQGLERLTPLPKGSCNSNTNTTLEQKPLTPCAVALVSSERQTVQLWDSVTITEAGGTETGPGRNGCSEGRGYATNRLRGQISEVPAGKRPS